MKEKRILAMFITSCVTLVASLAVTFGVLSTLADPVVATGVVRYAFAFNQENDSLISVDGDTLKLKEDIVFQPSSKLVWSEADGEKALWFDGAEYTDTITYNDESISTKLKVIPLKVTNSFSDRIGLNIKVVYDDTTLLGRYTVVKLYDYSTQTFEDFDFAAGKTIELGSNESMHYALVVFADDSDNTGRATVNFGTDYERINVEITKKY